MIPKDKTTAYVLGYQKGLDNSNTKNPYTKGDNDWQEWTDGYNEGYSEFIKWVNLMCN